MKLDSRTFARIGFGLVVLAGLWFGLRYVRPSEPVVTVDAAAPPASSPPLPPLPPRPQIMGGDKGFISRLPVSKAPSTIVLAERVDEVAVSDTTLYAFVTAPGTKKHLLIASDLRGGERRVLTELANSTMDLIVIGAHLLWTEHGMQAWLRRVLRADLDGTNIVELLPDGAIGCDFRPAGNGEYVLLYDDKVYLFDGSETPRLLVTGRNLDRDGGVSNKLRNLTTAATLAADGDRVYWSRDGDTVTDAMLYSVARTGGPLRIDDPAPSKLLGVTSAGIYAFAGGAITRRKDGTKTAIEGDARGRVDGARLGGNDSYVHLTRLVGQGEVQRVVLKLGHDATQAEPLVEAWSFDVTADRLYFATDTDVRVMAR